MTRSSTSSPAPRASKMAVRGWVAEVHLEEQLKQVPGVDECRRLEEEGGADLRVRYRGSRPLEIECKNVLRQRQADGTMCSDFQRTRTSKGDPARASTLPPTSTWSPLAGTPAPRCGSSAMRLREAPNSHRNCPGKLTGYESTVAGPRTPRPRYARPPSTDDPSRYRLASTASLPSPPGNADLRRRLLAGGAALRGVTLARARVRLMLAGEVQVGARGTGRTGSGARHRQPRAGSASASARPRRPPRAAGGSPGPAPLRQGPDGTALPSCRWTEERPQHPVVSGTSAAGTAPSRTACGSSNGTAPPPGPAAPESSTTAAPWRASAGTTSTAGASRAAAAPCHGPCGKGSSPPPESTAAAPPSARAPQAPGLSRSASRSPIASQRSPGLEPGEQPRPTVSPCVGAGKRNALPSRDPSHHHPLADLWHPDSPAAFSRPTTR